MERDEDVRMSCFLSLEVLRAKFGDELSYTGVLAGGFNFRGRRVPFLNRQKGIYRAAAQRGPAALSVQTSAASPHSDAPTELGFFYAYRAGDIDQPDNRALRAAHQLGVPIVYFIATRPGWYRAEYPVYVDDDSPAERRVLISPGRFVGPMDEPEPVSMTDTIERRYAVRLTKARLHQARFRGLVLPAYAYQCAICRLKEIRLLDAPHIAPDADAAGVASISNGLSLCTIHHRAFDENLVAVDPDYRVRVSRRLREDDDGPMLDVLKGFHGQSITLPRRIAWQPDRERLAARLELIDA